MPKSFFTAAEDEFGGAPSYMRQFSWKMHGATSPLHKSTRLSSNCQKQRFWVRHSTPHQSDLKENESDDDADEKKSFHTRVDSFIERQHLKSGVSIPTNKNG